MSEDFNLPYFELIECTEGFIYGRIDLQDMGLIFSQISEEVQEEKFEEGVVGLESEEGSDEPNHDVRSSSIMWIKRCKKAKKIINALVAHLNEEHFNFDISRKKIDYQYTLYSNAYDHYDWHQDQYKEDYDDYLRTLSLSLCLTPDDLYRGAELFLRDGDELNVRVFNMGFGEFVLFPATTEHRINALREGERASLVVWYGKESAKK